MTAPGDEPAGPGNDEPSAPLLAEPRDGVPDPLTTTDELRALVDAVRAGSGPVALAAKRASGQG